MNHTRLIFDHQFKVKQNELCGEHTNTWTDQQETIFDLFMYVCSNKYQKKKCRENEKRQLREYQLRVMWYRVHENGNPIQTVCLGMNQNCPRHSLERNYLLTVFLSRGKKAEK